MSRTFTPIRFASVLALAAMAAASQAVIFDFQGTSTSMSTTSPFTSTNAATAQAISGSPFSSITSALISFTAGTATFSSTSVGSLVVSFAPSATGLFASSASTITTATGAFAGFAGDSVNVSSDVFPGTTINNFSVIGNVTATPEPASFAALGVGLVALVRRRRKA